jgi:anti-sigma factor RsiW
MIHLSDELLNEYLDDALTDRAPVDEHLAQCADCAARLATLQALFTRLSSLPEASLSRDLAAPVMLRVRGSGFLPRWLTLTVALQAALALVVLIVAAPFVIEFASSSMPALQPPSLTQTIVEVQSQWMTWLDALSQFEMPTLPVIPAADISSLSFLLALAAVSMLWLVGNGLLLKNQIK